MRGDSILELDWSVGEIMKTLDRLKLTEKTLVVFCSDNGPVLDDGYEDGSVKQLGDHDPSGPFSGGKYTVLEGGTRTPFITRWPGKIPAGTSEEIVCTIDFATSFASMVGAAVPSDACRDSLNILPALLGESGAKGRAELLQQDNGTKGAKGDFGLRVGDWKLIRRTTNYKQTGFYRSPVAKPQGLHSLHSLPDDPAEKKDLSSENPEKAAELIKRLDEIIATARTRPE